MRLPLRLPAALAVAALPAAPGPAPSLAIVDVAVVDVRAGRLLEHRTVIVRGGRVVALGPADSISAAGAHPIEGRGRFLMPGLADLHVHLFTAADLLLYLANGVTTIRNLGGYGAADSILRIRREVLDGARLGPTIYTSGNWLDGDPPFREINTVLRTPADAAREVAAQRAAGFDFVKVYATLAPEVYRAVLDAARREGIPVTGHVPGAVSADSVLAGGQAAVDHLAQLPAADQAGRQALARRARERGVAVSSTLVMLQRALAMRGDPGYLRDLLASAEVRFLSPATREFWGRAPFVGLPRSAAARAQYPAAERLARTLVEEGALLMLGTDAGLWGNPPGFSALEEVRLLVAAGLAPAQALRAATLDPAEFLNRHVPGADQPGEVRVGMRADLLLLEADPLADVANLARRAGVMVRGRWLPEAELRDSLERLAAGYAR